MDKDVDMRRDFYRLFIYFRSYCSFGLLLSAFKLVQVLHRMLCKSNKATMRHQTAQICVQGQ